MISLYLPHITQFCVPMIFSYIVAILNVSIMMINPLLLRLGKVHIMYIKWLALVQLMRDINNHKTDNIPLQNGHIDANKYALVIIIYSIQISHSHVACPWRDTSLYRPPQHNQFIPFTKHNLRKMTGDRACQVVR